MRYLDTNSILELPVKWSELSRIIEETVQCLHVEDTVQPLKPYLRFKNLTNRIISMPAYVGGDFDVAGIKWIASFPENIHKGIPRAHSVTILNDANTGEPICIVNSAMISVLRTAAVSRMMVDHYLKVRPLTRPKIGLTGFGPIGQYHLRMIQDIFDDAEVYVYDLMGVDKERQEQFGPITVVDDWRKAYEGADIFMTCTVSTDRYVDLAPKPHSLHLNVSLRDYKPETIDYFRKGIVVDNWKEICRENTDIEKMHELYGLEESEAATIIDVVASDRLTKMVAEGPVLFNPMGMSVFDIAVAKYYMQVSQQEDVGVQL